MTKTELRWFNNYHLAEIFFEENGHLNISYNCEVEGVKLGHWIQYQRDFYKKEKLSAERINLLNDIKMIWDVLEFKWFKNYELAKEYYKVNSHLLIPDNHKIGDSSLGKWVSKQRYLFQKDKLSFERIKLLEDIGMIWDASNNTGTSFPEYLIYYISKNIFGEDKVFYRDNSLGFELDIYIPSLNCAIEYDGVRWHKHKKDIEKDLKCKKEGITLYRIREEGLSNLENSICYSVLPNLDYSILALELNKFFNESFSLKLDVEKINIQNIYNEYVLFKNNYLYNNWLNKFNLAKEFFEEKGHLRIIDSYEIKGIKIGQWIYSQRQKKKKGTLSIKQINLLESIGMIWDASIDYNSQWLENYNLAKKYYEENGNLLISERNIFEGVKLGDWVRRQRSFRNNNKLSDEQINLLNQIGMVWNIISYDSLWLKNYNKAKEYFEKNNNLLIKAKYKTKDGFSLGAWIADQRQYYKKRILTPEKIQLLEEIGMVWNAYIDYESQWLENYNKAKEYFNKNGDLNVSQSYEIEGVKLGYWINNQRRKYKNTFTEKSKRNKKMGTLSSKKINLLNEIGMVWIVTSKAT